MNDQTANPSSGNASRCRHFTLHGRQCRLRVLDSSSGLCFRHAGLRAPKRDPEALSADLLNELTEFHPPYEVNEFLARLLFLLVRNRISPKRAGVLTYIAAQLLHSLGQVRQLEKTRKMNLPNTSLPARGRIMTNHRLVDPVRERKEKLVLSYQRRYDYLRCFWVTKNVDVTSQESISVRYQLLRLCSKRGKPFSISYIWPLAPFLAGSGRVAIGLPYTQQCSGTSQVLNRSIRRT